MKIGFIGLGTIGSPIAVNLLRAGYELVVHDLDRGQAGAVLDAGARWVDSVVEAAEGCEALFTSLPGPRQVEDVMALAGAALPQGAIWVDLTTSDLKLTQRIAADLAANGGIQTLEAPITGGVKNAHIGKITIFTAGPQAAFDKMAPVLQVTAGDVFYFGDLGGASVVKLITNFVAFIHVIALGEGLVFGTRYGLDKHELLAAIKSSYADSFVARTDGEKIFDGDYASDFALGLAYKDMVLARQLAEEMGLTLDLTALTDQLYAASVAQFGEQAGAMAPVQSLEQRSGVALADSSE